MKEVFTSTRGQDERSERRSRCIPVSSEEPPLVVKATAKRLLYRDRAVSRGAQAMHRATARGAASSDASPAM